MEYFEAFRDYQRCLAKEGKTKATEDGYINDIKLFVNYVEKHYNSHEIGSDTKFHINSFIEDCRDNRRNTSRSLNRKRSSLKAFFSWVNTKSDSKLNLDELIDHPEPFEEAPRFFLSDKELGYFWAELQKSNDALSIRRRAYYGIMWHYGATTSEVANLKISDICSDSCYVNICNKKLPMSKELHQVIADYLNTLSNNKEINILLFPNARNAMKEFNAILEKINVSSKRRSELGRNSIKNTRIKKCIELKRDLLSIMEFFRLKLPVDNYINEIDCDLQKVFGQDKLFE